MADIVSQAWFWPAVVVSVGLPLMLIGLTEMYNALVRGAVADLRRAQAEAEIVCF